MGMNSTTPPAKVSPLMLRSLADGLDAPGVVGNRGFVPHRKPKEEEAPPPPTFDEADLKAAERDGYQKGFLEGVKEGRSQEQSQQASINAQLAGMSGQFAGAIMPLFQHYEKMATGLRAQVGELALTIARKVAGAALTESAAAHVTEITNRCCESLLREPHLSIVVHESLGDTLEKQLAPLAARMPESSHVTIIRDPNMALSDCRIEWDGGCMEHSTEQLWQRIAVVLEGGSVQSAKDNTADMQNLVSAISSAPPLQPAPQVAEAPAEPEANTPDSPPTEPQP